MEWDLGKKKKKKKHFNNIERQNILLRNVSLYSWLFDWFLRDAYPVLTSDSRPGSFYFPNLTTVATSYLLLSVFFPHIKSLDRVLQTIGGG